MLRNCMSKSADLEIWECDSGPYWVIELTRRSIDYGNVYYRLSMYVQR